MIEPKRADLSYLKYFEQAVRFVIKFLEDPTLNLERGLEELTPAARQVAGFILSDIKNAHGRVRRIRKTASGEYEEYLRSLIK